MRTMAYLDVCTLYSYRKFSLMIVLAILLVSTLLNPLELRTRFILPFCSNYLYGLGTYDVVSTVHSVGYVLYRECTL